MLGEGRPGERRIAVHQGAAVERSEQPFVRVDHERVSLLDPVQQGSPDRRHEGRTAVGGVDVEPGTELGCDSPGTGEIVDDARVRGPTRSDDGEHVGAVVGCPIDGGSQCSFGQPSTPVSGDGHDRHVEHHRCQTDRRVCARRAGDRDRTFTTVQAPPRLTCCGQRRQVAGGTAADERPTRSVGEPRQSTHPAQRVVLGVDRSGSLQPPVAVDRRGRHDEVEQRCRLAGCGRNECQVAGVVAGDAGRRQHVAEQLERPVVPEPRVGDHLAGRLAQLGGRERSVEWRW